MAKKNCEYCGKRFPNNGNVGRHIRTVHNGERSHECSQCERKFQQKSSLERHTAAHKRGFSWKAGEGSYTCDLCDKAFSNKSNLNKHRNKHTKATWNSENDISTDSHLSEQDLFSCRRCNIDPLPLQGIRIHLIEEHFKDRLLKVYGNDGNVCNICSRTLRNTNDLVLHIGLEHVPQL